MRSSSSSGLSVTEFDDPTSLAAIGLHSLELLLEGGSALE